MLERLLSKRVLVTIVVISMALGAFAIGQTADSYADDSVPTITLNLVGAKEKVDWKVLNKEPYCTTGEATFSTYEPGTAIERTWEGADDSVVPRFFIEQSIFLEKCGKPTGVSLSTDKGVVLHAFYANDLDIGYDIFDTGDHLEPTVTSDRIGYFESKGDIYFLSSIMYDSQVSDYKLLPSLTIRPPQGWVEVYHGDNNRQATEAKTSDNHVVTLYFGGAERELDIDDADMEVEAGQTAERVAKPKSSYYGDAIVTYTSSDESVATVGDTGIVTGVAAGEANITASIKNGDKGTSKSYKVVVTKAADPAIESLVNAINGLPNADKLTLDDENTVNAAQAEYDALTPEQQAQVTNYNVLLEARLKIADLKLEKAKNDITELTAAKETAEGELEQAELEKQAALDELQAIKEEIAASKLTVSGMKVTSKAKKFTITWKKNAKADGYQVQYRLKGSKKFKTLKTISKTKVVSKKLKKGKKYQFRVAPYKTINGEKVYGKYSAVKVCKCK